MSTPDSFMPFYGADFFQAVEGLDDATSNAYLRCIWYYWSHTHCEGLKDDDEFLRRLCRADRADWEEMKATIFDNDKFFSQDGDGFWHQKKASELWQGAMTAYERRVQKSKNAAKARWG